MQNSLAHFRALSVRLESDRLAFNTAHANLLERINTVAAAVARIEEQKGDASKERAEVRRLKAERTKLVAPSFIDPWPDVERYAATHANAEPVTVDVPNGQTPLSVHNNLAEKTQKVLAEIQRVVSAPAAPDDAALAAKIDAIATPVRLVAGELVIPRHVVDSNGMALTVVNTEGLFAWLNRDALIAKMREGAAANGPGLTAAERGTKLAALHEKFTNALRLEAAAAMAAEQAGQRVIRRRHVHPAILLGVKVAPASVWEWFAKKRGA